MLSTHNPPTYNPQTIPHLYTYNIYFHERESRRIHFCSASISTWPLQIYFSICDDVRAKAPHSFIFFLDSDCGWVNHSLWDCRPDNSLYYGPIQQSSSIKIQLIVLLWFVFNSHNKRKIYLRIYSKLFQSYKSYSDIKI